MLKPIQSIKIIRKIFSFPITFFFYPILFFLKFVLRIHFRLSICVNIYLPKTFIFIKKYMQKKQVLTRGISFIRFALI